MAALCIIPARGGSKGIVYKNVLPIGGHPLLAWSVRQALAARRVGRVVVSTDCDEIAAVAEDEGADVFWRSAATATDDATTESAVLEVLLAESDAASVTVLLQCTSPIRQSRDIDGCIDLLEETCADSVFSARRIEGYCWARDDLHIWPLHSARTRRQDRADSAWEENGSIYVFRTNRFLQEARRHCGRIAIYEMDPLDSFQIDEYADVQRMEALLPLRLKHGSHSHPVQA